MSLHIQNVNNAPSLYAVNSNTYLRQSSNYSLTISVLPPDQKIAQIARQWEKIALSKEELDTSSSRQIFSDLAEIYKRIVEYMENPGSLSYYDEIYVCKDVELKEIQAIAIVKRNRTPSIP